MLAEYRVRTTDFGIDLGRELGNYGEVRVGWGRSFGESSVRVGDPILAPRNSIRATSSASSATTPSTT